MPMKTIAGLAESKKLSTTEMMSGSTENTR